MAAMPRLAFTTCLGLVLAAGYAADARPASISAGTIREAAAEGEYAAFRRTGRHWRHYALRPPARIRVRIARRRAYRAIRSREEEIAAWRREFSDLHLRSMVSAE